MNDQIVELGPDNPQTKLAVAALLGSTLSELKNIEGNIIGSSSNIRALKTNVNQVLSQLVPNPVATTVNAGVNIQHLPVSVPVQAATPPPPVQVNILPEIKEDPNQLVFDFNKPITPETINNKLDSILSKLNDLDRKLNHLE